MTDLASGSVAALSDEMLIERARSGDDQAFGAIVDRYEAQVAATVIGMLGHGDEADDAGQETFIRLYRSLGHYRGDAALGTYLTRIAMNVSLTALRRRRTLRSRFVSTDRSPGRPDRRRDSASPESPGTGAADASDGPLEALLRTERREQVHRALAVLRPEHRAVVVLRWLNDLSTRETADTLGIPEGTVMSRLSRAMDRLRDELEGEGER